jgi:hypothetical protein
MSAVAAQPPGDGDLDEGFWDCLDLEEIQARGGVSMESAAAVNHKGGEKGETRPGRMGEGSPAPLDLVSTAVAALTLDLTPQRVYQLVEEEKLDAIAVETSGSRRLLVFHRWDLERFLREHPAAWRRNRPRLER